MNSSRTVGLEMGYRIWKVKRNQQQGQTLSDTAKAVLTKKYGRQFHRLLLQELGGRTGKCSPPIPGSSEVASRYICPACGFKFFFLCPIKPPEITGSELLPAGNNVCQYRATGREDMPDVGTGWHTQTYSIMKSTRLHETEVNLLHFSSAPNCSQHSSTQISTSQH